MFTALTHIIHFVTDIDGSKAFYRDVLGLKLKADFGGWVEFDLGNTIFALHDGQTKQRTPQGDVAFCKPTLGVASVDVALKFLKERNVAIADEPHEVSPGKWVATFRDPDGLPIGIYGPR